MTEQDTSCDSVKPDSPSDEGFKYYCGNAVIAFFRGLCAVGLAVGIVLAVLVALALVVAILAVCVAGVVVLVGLAATVAIIVAVPAVPLMTIEALLGRKQSLRFENGEVYFDFHVFRR